MTQYLNTELRLENCEREEHFLQISADTDGVEISIIFNILFKNEMMDLCGESIIDAEYFRLDKFQVGVLIDYLNRLSKKM